MPDYSQELKKPEASRVVVWNDSGSRFAAHHWRSATRDFV